MSNQRNETMDSSAVYTMFEEIKEKLDKQPAAQSTPATASVAVDVPALDPENRAVMETLATQLTTVSEKLDRPLKHHHTLDFMSNWVLIVLVAAVVTLFISLWVIDNQRRTIAHFRDNDLKYRYIQMKGEATPDDILMLRDIFELNRNSDSIKTIRRQVERYEQLIQQQAENEARARFNASEAQRLQNQAETVKGGK